MAEGAAVLKWPRETGLRLIMVFLNNPPPGWPAQGGTEPHTGQMAPSCAEVQPEGTHWLARTMLNLEWCAPPRARLTLVMIE